MDDFVSYLEKAFDLNFVQGIYNNTHRDLYMLMIGVIRYEADTFSISDTHFTISKAGNGVVSDKDQFKWEGMGKAFREGMRTILRQDTEVRKHIRVTEERPETATYELLGF